MSERRDRTRMRVESPIPAVFPARRSGDQPLTGRRALWTWLAWVNGTTQIALWRTAIGQDQTRMQAWFKGLGDSAARTLSVLAYLNSLGDKSSRGEPITDNDLSELIKNPEKWRDIAIRIQGAMMRMHAVEGFGDAD